MKVFLFLFVLKVRCQGQPIGKLSLFYIVKLVRSRIVTSKPGVRISFLSHIFSFSTTKLPEKITERTKSLPSVEEIIGDWIFIESKFLVSKTFLFSVGMAPSKTSKRPSKSVKEIETWTWPAAGPITRFLAEISQRLFYYPKSVQI